jgi:tetratricopeptide (TPR) repeat protein/predicted Ser/Thr protein kinase
MADAPLTPTRLERLQLLFEQALELPEGDRPRFLEQQAPADPALQAEVLALIRSHHRTDISFEQGAAYLAPLLDDPWIGTRLGPWAVTRRIGAGGMGAVYEAVRADDQYRKQVAIKFLHRSAENAPAIARFRAERQILANLGHPNIAALIDGGVTEQGQPYLVMEYIDGQSLTTWCDERRLTVRERLELFLQVCAAVESAHRGLVVHRDLKPGNILVTDDGRVKLLDFGIARLLTPDEDPDQPRTIAGHRSFTPEYASPEQVRGLPVATTADVYALGVILFELLAGRRPFDLQGKLLSEIEQVVCHDEPPRPSSLVDEARAPLLGDRSAARARSRVTGDLDAIVLMALRKEPARRYGSCDALAQDVQRHLDGRPVVARPEGVSYRALKLVRRRKLETALAAAVIISLVGGLVATARQARRAEAEGRRASQVTGFLTSMLGAADPGSLGKDVTVRSVLDSAAVGADTLRSDPALEAEVRTVIGDTYVALGEFGAGGGQFDRAIAARSVIAPAGDLATALILTRQSHALEFAGEYEQADSVLDIAAAMFAKYPFATRNEEIDFLDHRARIITRLGRVAEAEPLFQQSLALVQRYMPGDDTALAYAYVNLGFVNSEQGRAAAAESLYALGVAAGRRAFGNEHVELAAMLSPYATALARAGKNDLADSTFLEVLAMRRKLLGAEHPEYAWTMFNYADQLLTQQRYAEAAKWSREVLALRGKSLPETHMAISTSMGVLGRALGGMDSLAEGERYLRESLALRKETLPAGHWALASSESILGGLLVLAHRFGEAEGLLLPAEKKLVEARGEDAPVVRDARSRIVLLYTTWNRPAEAAAWQSRLEGS